MNASVVLIDPKYPHNVGGALRAAAIFGAEEMRWTGERVDDQRHGKHVGHSAGTSMTRKAKKWRLPREERMKAWQGVEWGHEEGALDRLIEAGHKPVCVEIVEGAMTLDQYVHPIKAVYVFGPEDGGVPRGVRSVCHEFVCIPTAIRTPLNLAAAINVVLYDRMIKCTYKGDRDEFALQRCEAVDIGAY